MILFLQDRDFHAGWMIQRECPILEAGPLLLLVVLWMLESLLTVNCSVVFLYRKVNSVVYLLSLVPIPASAVLKCWYSTALAG